MAVDHADHWFRQGAHFGYDQWPTAFAFHVLFYGVSVAPVWLTWLSHAFQVVSGTERSPGAGENHDTHVIISIAIVQGL
jgi:hypothetical protein